jgi:hypothetical protein
MAYAKQVYLMEAPSMALTKAMHVCILKNKGSKGVLIVTK